MKRNILSELLLYRYRYIIGYLVFAIVLFGALWISYQIPGQLTPAEKQSALTSATMSLSQPSTGNIVDLPYHLLQKASLHFFGITNLGVKFPSFVVGFLSAVGLLWLLRRWLLRDSIAIFTICIFVALRQFLYASQEGVPVIMLMFWVIFVLLFALKFTANNKSLVWSLLLSASLALSLYTPLSIFVVICLLAASLLHPHLRYVVSTIPRWNLLLCIVVAGILAAPLMYSLVKTPAIVATLTGWPIATVTLQNVLHNVKEIVKAYFAFWKPSLGEIGLTPIFGASSFVLIIFGLLKLLRDHHSARSYMLLMTLPVVTLPSLINPDFLILLNIPLILLMGLGIESLLDEWYKLFPHNPYARVTALIPMIILLAGIMVGNLTYYTNAYRYSPSLSQMHSYDLSLLRDTVKENPEATLLTNTDDKPFYALLVRDFPKLKVVTNSQELALAKVSITQVNDTTHDTGVLKKLVVDPYLNSPVRFYVYQK